MMSKRKKFNSLRAWRIWSDLSQADAAKILGVDPSIYYRWEVSETYPHRTRVKALSERTGVPIERLMGVE